MQPDQAEEPAVHRNDARSFTKYCWPDGLELIRYDDGRIKLGQWDTTVEVAAVSNFGKGASRGGAHIIARFHPQLLLVFLCRQRGRSPKQQAALLLPGSVRSSGVHGWCTDRPAVGS